MKKIRIYVSLLVATIFILSMFTPLFLANTIDNGKKGTTGVNYRSDYEGFRLNRDIFILDSNYLEDTKLTSYYPDYNHGARTSLNVDAEKNLVLMSWNLTDYEGFVLLDATLRLYQIDQRNIGDTITMTLTPFLNDSWVEGTGLGNVNGPDGATYNEWDYSNGALENIWNGYPNGPGEGDLSLPDSIMADSIKLLDEYIEFNVTEMIQKYLDGVFDWRNGFFMTSDLFIAFPSSESFINAPELKLTILEQNNPPYDPSNPDPSDGAIDVDINSDLSWDGGDPDYGDPVYYHIFFGTDSNPPFLLEIGPYPWNVTRISWNPEILDYQTQYYWRIIPYDDEVCGLPGPIWSFTTEEPPNDPPYVPSNPNPANGALDVDINADLSWTGGDPDPGDTVTYDVYFGTNFPPSQVAWDHGDTSYTLGVLDYEQLFYWRIVSRDNHGAETLGPLWSFTTEEPPNDPPYVPSNPNPANGALDVDINTDLSWTGGDPDPGDMVTYDVYFGMNPSPPLVVSDLDVASYDPGVLDYLTMYYWKVVSRDNHGAETPGPDWSFTTGEEPNDPPYVPSNPIPADGSVGVDVHIDVSWTGGDPDPGDTVTYDVYFGMNPSPPLAASDLDVASYDPGVLDYLTMYYWKVVSRDNHGAETPGPMWYFTTGEEPNDPPYVPSNPIPGDGAVLVDINADLSWTGGDPDPGDTVTYDVYFGTDPSPPLVVTYLGVPTYDPGVLDYLTMYYWKVVSRDNHGAETPGPIWSFTTGEEPNDPPYVPSNPNPANGALDVGINADLSWTGGDPDPGDTVTYDVYFGTNSPPPQVAWGISTTMYELATLDFEIQYFWKIVSWDNHGSSSEGPLWSFVTAEDPNQPPYVPSNPNPADGSVDIDINADLSWTGGDPDPGDTVTYDVYFGTNFPPPQVAWDYEPTTFDLGVLEYGQLYYWEIISKDNHGVTTPGPLWSFTTEDEPNNPPDAPSDPIPEDYAIDVDVNPELSVFVFDSNGDNLDVSFYDASGPTLIGFVAGVSSGTRPLVVWSGIEYSTSFSWYVEVYDGEYLIQSDTWEFLTMDEPNDPPFIPSNPDPADGAVEVDVNVDLSWVGGDPDPGDVVNYDVYFGNITPPPKIISNQSEDYYSPGTMNYNTTYYWMIIAWDTHGESSVGPLWSFTTNSSDPPSIPTILSGPSVGGPYVSLNFSVAYTEPSEYDVYYMWDWGDGNMSEWLGPYNSSEPANASYNWSRNETFDIRVKAKNIYEMESGWSYKHSISISKQLFLKNILPGFVYFRLGIFDESFAYIYLLEELRASVVLTNENLIVDVEANESVHTVEFEAYNQIWDEYTTIVDNHSDDGFSAKLINETGLWQLTVFAYDDNGNLIDRESIDFLLSIHFSSQQDPMRRVAKFGQRVKNKILSR